MEDIADDLDQDEEEDFGSGKFAKYQKVVTIILNKYRHDPGWTDDVGLDREAGHQQGRPGHLNRLHWVRCHLHCRHDCCNNALPAV